MGLMCAAAPGVCGTGCGSVPSVQVRPLHGWHLAAVTKYCGWGLRNSRYVPVSSQFGGWTSSIKMKAESGEALPPGSQTGFFIVTTHDSRVSKGVYEPHYKGTNPILVAPTS